MEDLREGNDAHGNDNLGNWEAVENCLNSQDLIGAKSALEAICQTAPELAEGWINLGSVERGLDEFSKAADHLNRGIELLSTRSGEPDPLLLPAWLSLAEIYEILEDIPRAEKALMDAFKRAPEMASAMIQLAGLKARSGNLSEAKVAAKNYCKAAVSILSEKASIGMVRKFMKALDDSESVDGRLLLIATREASAMAFDRAFDAFCETCPEAKSEGVLPETKDGSDVFLMKRADAVDANSGKAIDLLSGPIYGFPGNAPAAREVLFTVPAAIGANFPAYVCTRSAWNRMQIRIQFRDTSDVGPIERALPTMEGWFRRGFGGAFSDGQGRGFFHAMQRPTRLGTKGVRFDLDLGLSFQRAIDDLVDDLNTLHRTHPIDKLVFGDGLL